MFAYFIDDWVYGREHKRALDRLDLLLTQRGIAGRKVRLGRLNDSKRSMVDALRSGVRTFVAVGDDSTISKLLNTYKQLLAEDEYTAYKTTSALGTIPIGKECVIAKSLHIQTMDDAVTALAARHIRIMDVGVLNDRHYFFGAAFFPEHSALAFPTYKISSLRKRHIVVICNASSPVSRTSDIVVSPSDGALNAIIAVESQKKSWTNKEAQYECDSSFSVTAIEIQHAQKTITVHADAEKTLSTPVMARIEPRSIQFVHCLV